MNKKKKIKKKKLPKVIILRKPKKLNDTFAFKADCMTHRKQ